MPRYPELAISSEDSDGIERRFTSLPYAKQALNRDEAADRAGDGRGTGYLRGEALAVTAPGSVEVDEEELGGAHRRLEVALVKLQHAPVPRDLELRRLASASATGHATPWPQN